MNFLKLHINNIVNQDFLLKYQKRNVNFLPKIQKVVLSAQFGLNHKASIVCLFEILSFHKPIVCQSKSNVLSLNLRKGEPVGIKLILRKQPMYDFLIYFLFEILPTSKKFEIFKNTSKSLHWQIKDVLTLNEISSLYIYISDLNSLDIVIDGENLNSNFFQAIRFPTFTNYQT